MPFLSQTNFPRLWLLMQKTIGGNQSKQQLAIRHYRDGGRVLEIGCSVGNLADIFRAYKNISYTGIDVDSTALGVAKKRFKAFPGFSFRHVSLAELANANQKFDYVIFAGILHHVDNDEGKSLLMDALKLVAENGRLVISEPEALRASDNFIFKLFYNLEQGRFLRSREELERLIIAGGAIIESSQDCLISPGILKKPFVARFNLICAKPNHAQN